MKKLYIVRHFIMAENPSEALKAAKNRTPDEAYLSEAWIDKNGLYEAENTVSGFGVKLRKK